MGSDALPDISELWRAVGIYLQHAYPAGEPTPAVRERIERLRAAGEKPWDQPVFEKADVATGRQYGIRLGNAWYPHMKLTLEKSPAGEGYMLRVDTHDRSGALEIQFRISRQGLCFYRL